MVRLQPLQENPQGARHYASPSHYGSTATIMVLGEPLPERVGLHPTMVRLQLARNMPQRKERESLHPTMVRLQLLEKHLKRLVQAASPSHYGSTATIFLHPPIRGFLQSPSHYGSTATLRKHQRRIREEAVSIPLWFDCNGGGSPARAGPAQRSPSHYGSTATRSQYAPEKGKRESPSHYGSTATFPRVGGENGYGMSPSHYGSTATGSETGLRPVSLRVSIPLWFDCNDVKALAQDLIMVRLHPTMVRLQQYSEKLGNACAFLSPSHYGSTATSPEAPEKSPYDTVSIPLWFDCNR